MVRRTSEKLTNAPTTWGATWAQVAKGPDGSAFMGPAEPKLAAASLALNEAAANADAEVDAENERLLQHAAEILSSLRTGEK